ncbi:MAG: LysR family transcriptional regulator [Delftia acidovorans]|nr:MAG: LysR family transcriptional regulator [Delftia acidovorans]
MDKLRLITTFMNVAEAENFSRAAQSLHLSPQAVSQQISQLESWLGVRLFNRSTRRMALTEDGCWFYERCRTGLQAIDQGERELRDRVSGMTGAIKVASSLSCGQLVVAPLLAQFNEIYPAIRIELVTQNSWPDTVDLGMDIGVIGGPLLNVSLVARRVGRFTHMLCAAPAYLAAKGTPKIPQDLLLHRCIGLRHPRTNRIWPWTFQSARRQTALEPPLSLVTQDSAVQRQLVLQGAGIGQLTDYFARPLIASGALVELPLGYSGPRLDVHVFIPQREYMPRRTKLLNDFLYERLKLVFQN